MDQGKEFINETLKTWYCENGIDIQMTAPYSPSQNGVKERMNRTRVELARAMINKLDLPHFLWELAASHMVYLRNGSFTRIVDRTPYEIWKKKKPNIAHLREFGASVTYVIQSHVSTHAK
jgi:transposase InsO family protein